MEGKLAHVGLNARTRELGYAHLEHAQGEVDANRTKAAESQLSGVECGPRTQIHDQRRRRKRRCKGVELSSDHRAVSSVLEKLSRDPIVREARLGYVVGLESHA